MSNSRWREHAACNQPGVDPAIFFPEVGGNKGAKQARRICATCPVKQPCLYDALSNNETMGIWGGMTYRQRLAYGNALGISRADPAYLARKAEMRALGFVKPTFRNTRKQHGRCLFPGTKRCGARSGYVDGCRDDMCFAADANYHNERDRPGERRKRQEREEAA